MRDKAQPKTKGRSLLGRIASRPLQCGFLGVLAFAGGSAAALTLFGSARDGEPSIFLSLTTQGHAVSDENGAPSPVSFVNARKVNGHLVADPALIEDAPEGPPPVIAKDGREAMSAYAQSFDANDKRPKIAIVVTGLDVGVARTNQAIATLPPAVTLSFSPFALDAQSWIDKARAAGHEALMEVSMEPFDFPDSDPGPHALLVAASAEENLKRLKWAMGRATGYVGLANILGGRFMGEQDAIDPILAETAKRGLIFFDTGATLNSVVITGARHGGATVATGTLALDTIQTQAAIDTRLAELESQAHQDGFAIGVASLYPISIARLAEWAANANAFGFQLVPVSALAKRPSSASEVAISE